MITFTILFILLIGFVCWWGESTKIGRKVSNWLFNKFYGTHFDNIE